MERDMSLRTLAQKLELSPVYMSNIETDRKPAPSQENLDKLAEELPSTTVIVNGLLPVSSSHLINNQNIRSLNTALEELCQKRGLCYLDLYEEFAGEDGCLCPEYNLDSIHLTPAGYALWLSRLAPILDAAMQSN